METYTYAELEKKVDIAILNKAYDYFLEHYEEYVDVEESERFILQKAYTWAKEQGISLRDFEIVYDEQLNQYLPLHVVFEQEETPLYVQTTFPKSLTKQLLQFEDEFDTKCLLYLRFTEEGEFVDDIRPSIYLKDVKIEQGTGSFELFNDYYLTFYIDGKYTPKELRSEKIYIELGPSHDYLCSAIYVEGNEDPILMNYTHISEVEEETLSNTVESFYVHEKDSIEPIDYINQYVDIISLLSLKELKAIQLKKRP